LYLTSKGGFQNLCQPYLQERTPELIIPGGLTLFASYDPIPAHPRGITLHCLRRVFLRDVTLDSPNTRWRGIMGTASSCPRRFLLGDGGAGLEQMEAAIVS